jgi:5-methylcytosine-specific restriction endonuclease McrA
MVDSTPKRLRLCSDSDGVKVCLRGARTRQWHSLRKQQLRKQSMCGRCLSRGKLSSASGAHHKTAHKGNALLFFDPANLASSCKPCHDIDEAQVERGARHAR